LQKIALILVIVSLLLTSCSVFKYTEKTGVESSGKLLTVSDLGKIEEQNITKHNFFISKADIEIYGSEGTERAIFNLRYIFPGEYLLSIRNHTGIEAARIYISKDTVLVNDRINRRVYYGSKEDLFNKYGVDQSIIPILFGDFVSDDFVDKTIGVCMNGTLEKKRNVGDININYILDCKRLKVISAVVENENIKENINLKFSGFKKAKKTEIPGVIEIRNLGEIKKIGLKIRKFEYPWAGSINFVPGSKYEAIPLK